MKVNYKTKTNSNCSKCKDVMNPEGLVLRLVPKWNFETQSDLTLPKKKKKKDNLYFFYSCFTDLKKEGWINSKVDQILNSDTCQTKDVSTLLLVSFLFPQRQSTHNDILLCLE